MRVQKGEKLIRMNWSIPVEVYRWGAIEAAKRGMSQSMFISTLIKKEKDYVNRIDKD